MKKVFLVLMAVFMVSATAMAQTNKESADYLAGWEAGDEAGKASDNWIVAGVCCGIFGVGASYVVNPSVPKHELVGKSADYTAGYTQAYEKKSKKQQRSKALQGCVIGVGTSLLLSTVSDLNSLN